MNMKSSIFYLLVLTLGFASCIKKEVTPLADEGKTFVKILEDRANKIFLAPYTGIKSVPLFSVRRDANNSVNLEKSAAISMTRIDALVTRYNAANGTDFEILPDSLYTIASYISRTGNSYNFTMNSGDFARDFAINLNGTKWDLTRKYALGFALTSVGAANVKAAGRDTVIALISVKNKYDGRYKITGTFSDVSAVGATFSAAYPLEWELQTTGPSTCVVVDNYYLGIPGYVFSNAGSLTYYGSFGLIVNFDLATDAIASVVNYYGQPAGNTRSARLDPSGINAYNSNTKAINIKYFMVQPSVITAAPNIRSYFNETWSYLGPR